MITRERLMSLEYDTGVNYSQFKNLLFKGKDERHVHLQDRSGPVKKVYIELFMKYGSLIEHNRG